MQLISLKFLIFFTAGTLIYYLLPGKCRYLVILALNAVFYASFAAGSIRFFLPLLFVILVTYAGAEVLSHRRSRPLFAACVVLTILPLLIFKYSNFALENLDRLRGKPFLPIRLIVPVGLSFFTFSALGYLIDVFRGKTEPEKNLLRYAAFVSFFPTITSGPIERSDGLLRNLQEEKGKRAKYENIEGGAILFLFGAFIKLVLADRFAIVADTVFDGASRYGGAIFAVGAFAYTLQIYCDFSSYSLLALGCAKILGIPVIDNFKAPYFAESVQEFWRRWHISLSTWFRDYVYIPLGGSRCSKARRNANVFVTFLVSGFWHGADWTFLLWGGLHGLFQIAGYLTRPVRDTVVKKTGMDTDCASAHLWRKFVTFCLAAFAWIFFQEDSIGTAFRDIGHMFTEPKLWELTDGTLFGLGLDPLELLILLIAFLVLFEADKVKYRTGENLDEVLSRQNTWFKIAVVLFLILGSFIFGEYGPDFSAQAFIYMQF